MMRAVLMCALIAVSCMPTVRVDPPASASVAGWYEGAVQSQQYGEVQVTVNLLGSADTVHGWLHTPLGDFPVTHDRLTADSVILRFTVGDGDVGNITAAWDSSGMHGRWSLANDGGDLLLQRLGPPRPVAVQAGPRFDLGAVEWREDLEFLASELPRQHGSAFHTVSREEFEDSVRALDARLPSLAPHEVVVAMGRLVALVGDGHTYLDLPPGFRRYPIRLYAFGDTLRIVQATAGLEQLLGARVVSIGGTDVNAAMRMVRRQIAEENEWYVRSNLPWFMTVAEVLHAHRVVASADSSQWMVETPSGESVRVWLQPQDPAEPVRLVSAARSVPLYAQRPEEDLWSSWLPGSRTLYVKFAGYPPRAAFRDFFAAVLREADERGAERLAIDMRHNSGGDFTKGRELLLPLMISHRLNERGRLFVITGRRTFSAAMTNAADFLAQTQAMLVGEPTGARPNGWQEKGEFRLPNSGLAVSVSTRYYTFLDGNPPAVMPDRYIPLTWEDYRAGRDPVLEWITTQ